MVKLELRMTVNPIVVTTSFAATHRGQAADRPRTGRGQGVDKRPYFLCSSDTKIALTKESLIS